MSSKDNLTPAELMKSVLQRIATGPELSKNITREEAKAAMSAILNEEISDVRSAIFLIALRMKRETLDANLGVHDAMIDSVKKMDVNVDDLVNIADPYDKLLGLDVYSTHEQVIERLENKDIGWGYMDQKIFSPKLNNLMDLRTEIIKRPVVTTIEVLANPLISKRNHFVTGYVHKPYPPIYLMLARNAKFDSSIVIRGTEGGVIPSLRQKANAFFYKNISDENELVEINPEIDLGINQEVRAVKIPDSIIKTASNDKIETKVNPMDLAKESLKMGMDALSGTEGAMSDCILYGATIILSHVTNNSIQSCVKEIKQVLDSGSALKRFKK